MILSFQSMRRRLQRDKSKRGPRLQKRRAGLFEALEPRLAMAAFTPGNILVSNSPFNTQAMLYEYTPNGAQVQAIPIVQPVGAVTEKPRDLVLDSNGNVQIFNGGVDPRLTTYNPSSNSFSNVAFPNWNTSLQNTYGGIAAIGNSVFVTDQQLPGENLSTRGIVRFNVDNLNAGWTVNFDPNIGDTQGNTSTTIPHVTIQGTGDNSTDYYSFHVPIAGARGIFDIDKGDTGLPGGFRTGLRLMDGAGQVLASSFNGSPPTVGGAGSTGSYDAYLEYTFPQAGNYVIQVGSCCPMDSIPSTGSYELNISIESHSTYIPGGSGKVVEQEPNNTFFTPQNSDSAERIGATQGDTIDIAVGLDGFLYALVAAGGKSLGGTRIDVYDPNTLAFKKSITLPNEQRAIAVDQIGMIYATNLGIERYDQNGNLMGSIANPGTGGLIGDIDVASDGRIIAASNNGKVIVTNTTFDGVFSFNTRTSNGSNFVAFADAPLSFPYATNDQYRVSEGSDNNILTVMVNDLVDSRGELLITDVTPASQGGTVVVAGGRSLRYAPLFGFNGTETFTYTVVDGLGGVAYGQVTVDVSSVNQDPIANDDAITIFEDEMSIDLDPLGNDTTDPDLGETLTLTSVTQPNHGGTVEINGNGVRYKPAANYFGSEFFTYTISDGNGGSDTGTMTVTIIATNDNPTATNDLVFVEPGSDNTVLNVLVNDSSAPDANENLTIVSVSTPNHSGTVMIASTGANLIYKPAAGYTGLETFTYSITDGNGGSGTATVTVNVAPINNPPALTDDEYFVRVNNSGTTLLVLNNDTTAPDANETMNITLVSTPDNGGTVSITNIGQALRYQPRSQFPGIERFTYTVTDSRGASSTANVTVNVGNYNANPVGVTDTFSVPQNSTVTTLDVLKNDTDSDNGDVLTLVSVGVASGGGTVTVSDDKLNLFYTPGQGFLGTDTFTYVVADNHGGSATGTVNVTVRGWQNPANPLDVDKDANARPTSGDALAIINQLNLPVGQRIQAANGLLPLAPLAPIRYYDVNGDGFLTAFDVLLVINAINSQGSGEGEGGEAEGESVGVGPTATAVDSVLGTNRNADSVFAPFLTSAVAAATCDTSVKANLIPTLPSAVVADHYAVARLALKTEIALEEAIDAIVGGTKN